MSARSFGVAVVVDGAAVGGLTSVSLSGSDVAFIDTTTHATSTAKTFTGGLVDNGTIQLEGHLGSDAGQTKLKGSQGGAPISCTITFSDGSTASFTAVIGPFDVSNPLDEIITFTSSLKISGDVTWA